MKEWLNTARAAELLGLSEASVRRLADRGALRVKRVGRRGDRRFRAEDVARFQAGGRAEKAGVAATPQVVLGGVAMDAYVHLATFYDSDAGRLRVAAPFLESGLRAGQPCFLIARGRVLESHLERLRRSPGLEVDEALSSGRLAVFDAPGATVPEAIAFWEHALWKAMERGPAVLHGVGEMAGVRDQFASESEMFSFEAGVNALAKRFPCALVCQYDVREFTGQALYQVLRTHPDLFSRPVRTLLS